MHLLLVMKEMSTPSKPGPRRSKPALRNGNSALSWSIKWLAFQTAIHIGCGTHFRSTYFRKEFHWKLYRYCSVILQLGRPRSITRRG